MSTVPSRAWAIRRTSATCQSTPTPRQSHWNLPVAAVIAGGTLALLAYVPLIGFSAVCAAAWSAVLLLIAAGIGVLFLVRFRDWAFAAVLLWAFYGVYLARPEVTAVVRRA